MPPTPPFTEDDLAYNRAGAASPRQSQRFVCPRRGCLSVVLAVQALAVGYIVLVMLFGAPLQSAATSLGIGVLILTIPLLALTALPQPKRLAPVSTVSGTAHKQIVTSAASAEPEYSVRIGQQTFTVTREVYDALDDEAQYMAYFMVIGSKHVLVSWE